MDTLVLDIETKDMYGPSSGKILSDLSPSFVGVYSYNQKKMLSFFETDFPELKKLMEPPALLVGFSSNRFDLPILSRVLNLVFDKHPRVDLCEELELRSGRRVGLNTLALINLGRGKTGHGTEAPQLFAEGRTEELKSYCCNDVQLTKDLYDLVRTQKFLKIPKKDSIFSNQLGLFEKDKVEKIAIDLGPLLTFL
jgi:DEAD/DEAH box helicase domain-containing protein